MLFSQLLHVVSFPIIPSECQNCDSLEIKSTVFKQLDGSCVIERNITSKENWNNSRLRIFSFFSGIILQSLVVNPCYKTWDFAFSGRKEGASQPITLFTVASFPAPAHWYFPGILCRLQMGPERVIYWTVNTLKIQIRILHTSAS